MARWRQGVSSVAMSAEEFEKLGTMHVSEAISASGAAGANAASAIMRTRRSLRWGKDLACIIRRFERCVSGRWPMARSAHWMIGRDRARSRRLLQSKAWLCLWLATSQGALLSARVVDDAAAGTHARENAPGAAGAQISRQT